MYRTNKHLTRLKNLENSIGAHSIQLEFSNGARVAVPLSTRRSLALVIRCMEIHNSVLNGASAAPDPDDKILALFASSTRASGKAEKTAASLRHLSRFAMRAARTGRILHYIGNQTWKEAESGKLFNENLDEVKDPSTQGG